MEKKERKVFGTLSPEMLRRLNANRAEASGFEETVVAFVTAALRETARRRQAQMEEHRAIWSEVEKQFGLDPEGCHHIDRSTGEVFACEHDDLDVRVVGLGGEDLGGLGELLQKMVQRGGRGGGHRHGPD